MAQFVIRSAQMQATSCEPCWLRPLAYKEKIALAWKQRCADWRRRYPLVLPEHKSPEGRVSVYNFAEVMSSILNEGDFCISGSSGTGIELFLLAFRTKCRQRIFHTTALGAMGFGIPASIGAGLVGAARGLEAQHHLRGRRRRIPVQHSGTGNDYAPETVQ